MMMMMMIIIIIIIICVNLFRPDCFVYIYGTESASHH